MIYREIRGRLRPTQSCRADDDDISCDISVYKTYIGLIMETHLPKRRLSLNDMRFIVASGPTELHLKQEKVHTVLRNVNQCD
jgi:hypothetical protein